MRAVAASGRLVHGDPEKVRLGDAEPERAAFLDTLLIFAEPDTAAPHEVEPFGQAATVLAHRDTTHATDLVARDRGSLAARGRQRRPGPDDRRRRPPGTAGCTCSTR